MSNPNNKQTIKKDFNGTDIYDFTPDNLKLFQEISF